MDDDQQFCLRWNNHQSTLISVFDTLLENETLVDCTLAAEGKFLKAHKVVLSACSPYFATLLQEQYDKHPIFILKDVKYQELRAMMDYMYRGEVNISQDQLAALLKAAESLQIKGLSDNRSGGGTTAPKPEHHRATMPSKLSAGYTLEQTKRARIAGPAEPEIGSREGSSSPSRRRRKVRRRSIENAMTDVHDNSNSSQQLQQIQSNASGLGAITAAASALAAAAAAAPNTQSLASNLPLSASTSSSTAVTATGTTLSSSKKTDIVKGTTQQQQQIQQHDAMNTDNAQGPASATTVTGSLGTETIDVAATTATEKSNHKQMQQHKQAKDSINAGVSGAASSDLVIEPKAEYDDEANDEPVEDLTLDEEDMGMDDLDQNAGTSQGGEGSSQGYAPWQHDRSQDELLLATQEAQQRDPQGSSSTESYWTIVETVPYTLANSQTNGGGTAAVTNVISTHSHHHQQQQDSHTTIHQHHHQQPPQQQQQHVTSATDPSSLIASATVVVEIPSDTVGMPGSTIHYTLPKGTTTTDHQQILRNVQTSSALTAAYSKLANAPATIQIVKQTSNNAQHQTTTRMTTSEANLPDVQHATQTQHHQVQHITLQECLDATTTNVLQQQQQQQHQHHHAPTQHLQQTSTTTTTTVGGNSQQHSVGQMPQEYIKIDTSRFEDKVLLRNVVQYEQQQQQQHQQHQTIAISTTPTTTNAGTQATIIVNESTAQHLEANKDIHRQHHHHHQQQQEHHIQQQQQHQHEQLLAESVTTSASEADDLDDLGELKPLITNHNVASNTTNSNLLPPPTTTQSSSSHHDTASESDNEKFLTPTKRIKAGTLKPSDMAAAGLQYVCNVCGKSYKIKGSLKRHKSYECGVAPGLSCPYCPHKCKYKSDLRKHISQKHALNITTASHNLTI